jgi:hypothetical protein
MKRVKLMLSAIAVLASVGGALAFKAHSAYSGGNVYTKADGATTCTVRVLTLTGTTIGGTPLQEATFPKSGTCVDISVNPVI